MDRQKCLCRKRMRTLRFIVLDILGLALIVQGTVRFEGPVIMASLIYVLLTVIEYFPQIWNLPFPPHPDQEDRIYEAVHQMLHTEKFTAAFVLLPPVALSGNAAAVCVLLPFAVLAYYLRKLYRIKKEEN